MRVGRIRNIPIWTLLAGALLLPRLAGAADGSDPGHPGGYDAGLHGGPPHPPGPPGPGDESRPPPFLMDLKLTDDQQDKVFMIMHAAAPALRDQSKALHKARDALHDLTRSAQFNTDAATTLAQAEGKAESQLELLRTRTEHDVFAILTTEQRNELAKHEQERESHRGEGPGHF